MYRHRENRAKTPRCGLPATDVTSMSLSMQIGRDALRPQKKTSPEDTRRSETSLLPDGDVEKARRAQMRFVKLGPVEGPIDSAPGTSASRWPRRPYPPVPQPQQGGGAEKRCRAEESPCLNDIETSGAQGPFSALPPPNPVPCPSEGRPRKRGLPPDCCLPSFGLLPTSSAPSGGRR